MAADEPRDPSSFLGTGWSFPPAFSRDGGMVEMASGVEDVHQSLQILLGTRLGERVMQEDYGCNLDTLVFEEIDQGFINLLTGMVTDAIVYHEPRVDLLGVEVLEDREQVGVVYIEIDYAIRGTNSRFNMVYPFHTKEATVPGS